MFFEDRLLPKIDITTDALIQLPYFQQLLTGTLPRDAFKYLCKQSYLQRFEHLKAWSVGFSKCDDYAAMAIWYGVVKEIFERELPFYRSRWNKALGIDFDQVAANNAVCSYSSHELAKSWEGYLAEQVSALLPHHLLSMHLSQKFSAACSLPKHHIYQEYMALCTEDWFISSCKKLISLINKLAADKSEKELKTMEKVFAAGCNYEFMFWRSMNEAQEEWPLKQLFPA